MDDGRLDALGQTIVSALPGAAIDHKIAFNQLTVAVHADKIRDYLAHKPKGKFGAHKYTAEDWGLDSARIHRDLAPYLEYYRVPRED